MPLWNMIALKQLLLIYATKINYCFNLLSYCFYFAYIFKGTY